MWRKPQLGDWFLSQNLKEIIAMDKMPRWERIHDVYFRVKNREIFPLWRKGNMSKRENILRGRWGDQHIASYEIQAEKFYCYWVPARQVKGTRFLSQGLMWLRPEKQALESSMKKPKTEGGRNLRSKARDGLQGRDMQERESKSKITSLRDYNHFIHNHHLLT